MGLIKQIKEPIVNELNAFESMYKASISSSIELTEEVTNHIFSSGGKQIRPILTLLSAGIHGAITEKALRSATALELLHTATLTHDDVIDNSLIRRNKETINAIWGNKIAILTGDYFLSILLDLLLQHNDYDTLQVLAKTVKQITEGEFLQQQISINFDYSEETYFDIIRNKTASLIAACCTTGMISANAPENEVQKMHRIGEILGLVFQIKDDILDYAIDSESGKLSGNDIRELKFTLPLIHYLNNIETKEKDIFLEQYKKHHADNDFVTAVIEKVVASGGIAYAKKKMNLLTAKAEKELSGFPDSPHKKAFQMAVNYITDRNS